VEFTTRFIIKTVTVTTSKEIRFPQIGRPAFDAKHRQWESFISPKISVKALGINVPLYLMRTRASSMMTEAAEVKNRLSRHQRFLYLKTRVTLY
jgi:hypothetical protein